jgi:hypothetical protein
MKNIEKSAEDYAIGEAEKEENIGKEKIDIAKDGFIAGARLYELHILNLIWSIDELTSKESMIQHSNSFRVLKELVGYDSEVKET